ISAEEANNLLNQYRAHDVRDDFSRLFYRNAVNRQHALSVNGGAQNIAWGISLGADQNSSNLSQATNRYTLSFNNSYKIAKILDVGVSFMYANSSNITGAPGYGSIRGAKN